MSGSARTSRRTRFSLLKIAAFCLLALVDAQAPSKAADDRTAADLRTVNYHLTARPWQQSGVTRDEMLEVVAGVCRFAARHQDQRGAVIDPFLDREHQYATPYFARAVATLITFDTASDVWPAGVRAMEHATACLAGGSQGIPHAHGEFFLAPLVTALDHYRGHVERGTLEQWRDRLRTPLEKIMRDQHGRINNWRTYAMRGEWLRVNAGLVPRLTAIEFIENAWLRRTQRERIVPDRWNFYQDWSSDPQSHAVEFVGRGNLLGLVAAGYDGASADEMRGAVERGSLASLYWQDPTGQCPPNGRTDDHVFNDVLCQLTSQLMANRTGKAGHARLAGQFQRAAMLSFRSIQRWRRTDEPWEGSFYVTKNHFDPRRRVGYQPASQYTNYNGAVMYHLAEASEAFTSDVIERPAPAEIGGYAKVADPRFGSAVINAGGMQLQINLRGDTVPKYNTYWTPLGIVRLSRVGWDSRLGPSDGAHDSRTGHALSFAPTWQQGRRWVRLAEQAEHYRGTLSVGFVHPLLVRCRLLYHTVTGRGGPTFTVHLTVTPDGVLARLESSEPQRYGWTVPLLVDDGRLLEPSVGAHLAGVRDPVSGDEQKFLFLDDQPIVRDDEDKVRSSYGWLRAVRVEAEGKKPIRLFVYPRNQDDPTAAEVQRSFQVYPDGFSSMLGRVDGKLYVGRTSAGGFSDRIDLDSNGAADVSFDQPCGFIVQLADGQPVAIETDRAVDATIQGESIRLRGFEPVILSAR